MLIPSQIKIERGELASLSRRVNANSQRLYFGMISFIKLIKKGEC